MNDWVLGVQLDGEWEHCSFATRQEALASFIALTTDYPATLEKAVLFRQLPVSEGSPAQGDIYLN